MEVLLSVAAPEGRAFEVGDLLDQGARLGGAAVRGGRSHARRDSASPCGQHFMRRPRPGTRPRLVLERAIATAQKSGEPALKARALCTLASLRVQKGDRAAADALMAEALRRSSRPVRRYALARAACLATPEAVRRLRERRRAHGPRRHRSPGPARPGSVPGADGPHRRHGQPGLRPLPGRPHAAGRRGLRAAWTLFEEKGLERTTPASITLNNWSVVHFRGDIARAEVLCRRAVELRRLIEGTPGSPPASTFNHAGALLALGRYDEARRLFEETIATAAARQSHRTRFDAMMELADLDIEEGDLARRRRSSPRSRGRPSHPASTTGGEAAPALRGAPGPGPGRARKGACPSRGGRTAVRAASAEDRVVRAGDDRPGAGGAGARPRTEALAAARRALTVPSRMSRRTLTPTSSAWRA